MIANLLKFALIRYLTWVIGEEGKEKNFHVYLLFYLLFSHSVVSNSLQPHGLQHTRPPCPSPTPGVYSNPCPLSRWCHPTISSSIIPFSSRLQSSPASGSFPMSWLFASRDQSNGVSEVTDFSRQSWFSLCFFQSNMLFSCTKFWKLCWCQMIKGKLDSKRNVSRACKCVLVKDYFTARNWSPLTGSGIK